MIFEGPGISVSSVVVTIGGMDYPIRNISAVGVEKEAPSSCLPLALFFLGLGCGTCGVFSAGNAGGGEGGAGGALLVILGLIFAVPGVIMLFIRKPVFHLVFETNSGRKRAWSTPSEATINAVRSAINQALAGHVR